MVFLPSPTRTPFSINPTSLNFRAPRLTTHPSIQGGRAAVRGGGRRAPRHQGRGQDGGVCSWQAGWTRFDHVECWRGRRHEEEEEAERVNCMVSPHVGMTTGLLSGLARSLAVRSVLNVAMDRHILYTHTKPNRTKQRGGRGRGRRRGGRTLHPHHLRAVRPLLLPCRWRADIHAHTPPSQSLPPPCLWLGPTGSRTSTARRSGPASSTPPTCPRHSR